MRSARTHGFEGFLHPSAPFVPAIPSSQSLTRRSSGGEGLARGWKIENETELVTSDGRALGLRASREVRPREEHFTRSGAVEAAEEVKEWCSTTP